MAAFVPTEFRSEFEHETKVSLRHQADVSVTPPASFRRQRARQTFGEERFHLRQPVRRKTREELPRVDPELGASFAAVWRDHDCQKLFEEIDEPAFGHPSFAGRDSQIPEVGRQDPFEDEYVSAVLPAGLLEIHEVGDFRTEQGDRSGHLHAGLVFPKGEEVRGLT